MNIDKITTGLTSIMAQAVGASKKANLPASVKKAFPRAVLAHTAAPAQTGKIVEIPKATEIYHKNDKGLVVEVLEPLKGMFVESDGTPFSGYMLKTGADGILAAKRFQDGELKAFFDGTYRRVYTKTSEGLVTDTYDINGKPINSLLKYRNPNEFMLTTFLPNNTYKKEYRFKDKENGIIHNIAEMHRNGQVEAINLVRDLEGNIIQKGKEKTINYFVANGQDLLEVAQENSAQKYYLFPRETRGYNIYPTFAKADFVHKDGFLITEDLEDGTIKFVTNRIPNAHDFISTGIKKGDNVMTFSSKQPAVVIVRGYKKGLLQFKANLFDLPIKEILKADKSKRIKSKAEVLKKLYETYEKTLLRLDHEGTKHIETQIEDRMYFYSSNRYIQGMYNMFSKGKEELSKNDCRLILDIIS